jgi:hypothetical protein
MHAEKLIKKRFEETYAIMNMPDKVYKKFHEKYMGETITDEEVFEARLLIVKMCLNTLVDDCEVVLDEIRKADEKENIAG